MDHALFITKQGMELIQRRISHLMNNERPDVIKAVATAREFGDLSENAEYKAAREQQRAIDGEIDYLRRRSALLKVVDTDAFPRDMVRFGLCCETLEDETGEQIWYRIVGVEELNYAHEDGIQAVSVVSPIGKALMGKKEGEICTVQAPMGLRRLRILAVK
ncbi:MAG: transcription elongation factor GreA [Candidatus Cloacimonetes bacterium]|nr:transcription elongation factor GreA [Candidatus Cloacimonadota bacterium]